MNTAHPRDTIAAISTPPGPGGVGMVRITGDDALAVGRKIFTPLAKGALKDLKPKRAVVGHSHQPNLPESPIDQAVFLYFKGPHSFTGEDTVEITAHGGTLIMGSLLEAAVLAGARLAEPGEFTRRAFQNGRIDLSQAEAVASLIFASTEDARQVMLKQVEGAMGQEAVRLREGLLEVKVALESAIDFPEDVEEIPVDRLTRIVKSTMERSQAILDTARKGIALNEGLRVVIAGAPNVGKSSLLNALLQENRAIVHEVAGTTRDFIEGHISVRGIPLVIVDTAGIRSGADPLEGEGITRTLDLMERADLLLVVVDGSRKLSAEEEDLILDTESVRRVVAVNKSDLPTHPDLKVPDGSIKISALTGEGISTLKSSIHDTYTGDGQTLAGIDAVVTSLRQAQALRRIHDGCESVIKGLLESREPELLTVDLEEALQGVGELTGEIAVDEVLEEIFSRFCIGK